MAASNPRQSTFEQGEAEALVVAIATLVRVLPAESKEAFIYSYSRNAATWDDASIALPVSEKWRQGVSATAASLLRLAKSKGPQAPEA